MYARTYGYGAHVGEGTYMVYVRVIGSVRMKYQLFCTNSPRSFRGAPVVVGLCGCARACARTPARMCV